jgi:orotidine-5'-phosphate decarboxylase
MPFKQHVAERLIVALDSTDLHDALRVAKRLQGLLRYAKIGSALFTAEGPAAIQRVRALGFEVFLDLKFHDIPSTVEKSCRVAARHRVAMLTVHACGEPPMLEAAVAGTRREASRLKIPRPWVIGVTVLTSIASDNRRAMRDRVVALAAKAKRAGLDGVVASAHEASAIRRHMGKPFVIICPGIRPHAKRDSDQRRVASPREAIAGGADFLVVGRPITEAKDPRAVAQRLLTEMEEALRC